ncbi:hypothetical protein CABS01_11134 [Colletotrichum abscissum]|uniref:uncharacterized protein n=1 Tax=Colletotrichum abscissum TaxID=1671311 RepID=UPI0027D672B5|nr:uncharacterized protein CABS01_11134 [Colletotrichum abscissum]KAK1494906.1 hypothetical protein CABS01_11134 [Colletotrichum abscissum]
MDGTSTTWTTTYWKPFSSWKRRKRPLLSEGVVVVVVVVLLLHHLTTPKSETLTKSNLDAAKTRAMSTMTTKSEPPSPFMPENILNIST